jgi:hypothetical protein
MSNSPFSIQHSAFRVRSRGVVLIVVLGMLAVLALIGVAFLTFSAEEEQSSTRYLLAFQSPRADLNPELLFPEALSQLIADTDNMLSNLRGHSLLRDMYGNDNDIGLGPDGVPGTINGGPNMDGDDDGDGIINNATELGWPGSDDQANGVLDTYDHYQRAFNGPGEAGPDGILGTIDDADVNYVYNTRIPEYFVVNTVTGASVRGGGADEDYEYPDHNNMFLAAIRADGTVLLPSFHRPGYLRTAPTNDWTDITLLGNGAGRGRRLLMRPRQAEHTVSFPYPGAPAVLPVGEYDVDNMGLGRKDSVWIDLGYPVQMTLDGRKFKPLFAFLIMDMDGKINANVHGNYNLATGHSSFAAGPDGISTPLGSGWSATEVVLQNLMSDRYFPSIYPGTGSLAEYRQIFEGVVASNGAKVPGRWGDTIYVGDPMNPPRPGGRVSDDDRKHLASPGYYIGYPGTREEGLPFTKGGVYRSPPDFDADGGLYLQLLAGGWGVRTVHGSPGAANGWGNNADWTGIPNVAAEQNDREHEDEPTEMNLHTSESLDTRFTPSDLELLRRAEDVDANSLLNWVGTNPSARLGILAPSYFNSSTTALNQINRRRRGMLTTESADVNRFNMFPFIARDSAGPADTVWASGKNAKYNGFFPDLYRNPPIRAQRYNANTIEGPAIPEAIRYGRRLNIAPRLTNRADKYRLARDIYVMLSAICGNTVPSDRLAQFAINVVDFQDTEVGTTNVNAEEVMEPFEFDTTISNGFYVNGNWVNTTNDLQAAESDVVWGTEAPRLIISETLAYEEDLGGGAMQVRLWIEIFNMSDKTVTLHDGAIPIYELIWGDGNGDPDSSGEPDSGFLNNRLVFDVNAPVSIGPGQFLVVSPEPIPAKLGGGPDASAIQYTPAVPYGPSSSGPFRLFLRRLADPNQAEDVPNRFNFPRSANPYISVDALDFVVHNSATFNNPLPNIYGTVTSRERISLSVRNVAHAPAAVPDGPTHTIGLRNDASTELLPRIPFLDRPLASSAELLFVPAVGAPHVTTAFAPMSSAANLYVGQDGGEDSTVLETGDPRTSPIKNSDGDYLYSYLFNFYREDPTGNPPANKKGKGKGKAKGRVKRALAATPNPGFYRMLEFVEVPPRSAGSRDPNIVDPPGGTAGRSRRDRIPGKININTIWEQETLQAWLNNHPLALDPAAASWFTGTIPVLNTAAGIPLLPDGTQWPNSGSREQGSMTAELWRRVLLSIANSTTPIPTSGGAPLVGDNTLFTPDDRPFRTMTIGMPNQSAGGLPASVVRVPTIHDTLLRGLTTASNTRGVLLDDRGLDGLPAAAPPGLFGQAGAPTNLASDAQFQLQAYQKLSNTFTTRSNVYAVWVTVGFFEIVDKDLNGNGTIDALGSGEPGEDPSRLEMELGPGTGITNAPPRLGAEINVDIGQNVRHRAFFIIDRSRARGYLGPPRSSEELQDVLSQVVIHSRIVE